MLPSTFLIHCDITTLPQIFGWRESESKVSSKRCSGGRWRVQRRMYSASQHRFVILIRFFTNRFQNREMNIFLPLKVAFEWTSQEREALSATSRQLAVDGPKFHQPTQVCFRRDSYIIDIILHYFDKFTFYTNGSKIDNMGQSSINQPKALFTEIHPFRVVQEWNQRMCISKATRWW